MSVPEQQKLKTESASKAPPVTVPVSQPQQAVRLQARADTAYSTDWTPEEQVALDATLDKLPIARHSALERYVRAAAALPKKGVRDVALRVIWLANNATKRRAQDDSTAKKRPRVQSIFAVQPKGVAPLGGSATGPPRPGFPATVQGHLSSLGDHSSNTVGTLGGPTSQLLEQNYMILSQYKQNMQQYKVNENTSLLVQFRDNILTILNQMSCMTGLMQHMPDLPVRLNEDLANSFLPKATTTLYGGASQGILPATASHRLGSDRPATLQQHAAAKVQPVVPVTTAQPSMATAKSLDTKASSGKSKSKSSLKRGASIKSEERSETPRPEHLRSSARRAALKGSPVKQENVRSSARLAAASDSAQS